MNYQSAKKEIKKLLNTNPNGEFTHNIISLTLSSLAKSEGEDKADKLIKDLNLNFRDSKGN